MATYSIYLNEDLFIQRIDINTVFALIKSLLCDEAQSEIVIKREVEENVEDDTKCINCGKPAKHMHHVVPKSLGGNDNGNRVPLCEKCHGIIHSINFTNHSTLTKAGLQKAKERGVQLGGKKGQKLVTKKSIECKEKILKLKEQGYTNVQAISILNISKNTYYKYLREIKQEQQDENKEE